ncbi:MAG: asparagine synthase (glutamine-hydrolyzing) [Moorea sp. SIO3I7]|uniref:asparagine synthase (glutamine-hydrolyzing) n=1 Tax=unclassified Moorena TaxID=2683338 RepID=UPI0013C2195C|nr:MULTISPECIES: asparagine synthase (glutamine-hydrolyzing) [unclassified Moorena]NEN95454.1 asparagine synthase (glutamine-hydrolyzing) [Moorena sp. SIO3I7]NEO09091.1 asparagine synthase (glutamine-hydrolyzing) [Moorena sp. SIO3I8]NEO22928.1 asparagine synthase (glutamine-hydrolyzing) [Moorena sp. SIO4A5]NEP20720.1 asparagine synthase (glutamine-hydrolyzing) [Moorena sp. SIO3I6]
MCGIVAMLSTQEQISESSLKRGIEHLNHRGPDGQKIWISPEGRVGLGHARLSIIDLTGGEQPIANRDETLRIIVNGEFYDFERIQQDLRRWGYQLLTQSDSEIALHLYDEFGTECLQHLRGEFAFMLWDQRKELLFAVRDRFGIKPLYYAVHGNTLYLASEVKALFAAGVPAHWDREALVLKNIELLAHNHTLFANVYQVPPGHFLMASHSGIKLQQYWDFDYPQITDSQFHRSEEDYIEQLRDTLHEAIRLRLEADVPVGCYLSGGLDSSTVLGMASIHVPEPIQAFTLSFEQDIYDEKAIAIETAARARAKLEVIQIRPSDLIDNFADAVYQSEMLCNNTNGTAKYLLSRATRDAGYKVVLTGEGSDEIFGGYAHFRQDMWRHNAERQDEQTIKNLLEQLKQSNKVSAGILFSEGEWTKKLASVDKQLGFIPAWMEISAVWHRQFLSLYSPELVDQFSYEDTYQRFLEPIDTSGQLSKWEPVHKSLYLWAKSLLPNNIFRVLGDGVEMAHSIEGRLPFLDHKVVELVCRMPISMKIRGLTEKYVLREAARPFLTDTVYHRQKHPFLAPPSTLKLNKGLFQFTQDILRSSDLASIYNQSPVTQLLDKIPDMDERQRISIDPILMKMVSSCIIQKRFGLT